MGFYDSLALTAQNLIRSKGAAVVLKRAGTPMYTASEGTAETPYAEFGTFAVTIDGMLKEVDGMQVLSGDKTLYMESSVKPAVGDMVVLDSEPHAVVAVQRLAPAGVVVIYTVLARLGG